MVPIFPSSETPPTLPGGHAERLSSGWDTRISPDGDHDVLTDLQATLLPDSCPRRSPRDPTSHALSSLPLIRESPTRPLLVLRLPRPSRKRNSATETWTPCSGCPDARSSPRRRPAHLLLSCGPHTFQVGSVRYLSRVAQVGNSSNPLEDGVKQAVSELPPDGAAEPCFSVVGPGFGARTLSKLEYPTQASGSRTGCSCTAP